MDDPVVSSKKWKQHFRKKMDDKLELGLEDIIKFDLQKSWWGAKGQDQMLLRG